MASTKKKKTEIRTSVYIPKKKMVPFAKVYLFSNPYHSVRTGGLK